MNLVFDYDGTLHESMAIYAPAVRHAYARFVERGAAVKRELPDAEISRWIGHSAPEAWNALAPDAPPDLKMECTRLTSEVMLRLIRGGGARLYPGAGNALSALKNAGHMLIFLSNCGREYMDAHIEAFKLDRYFAAFYCSGDFAHAPKHEIFGAIKDNFSGGFIVLGDRNKDMDIARFHGLKFVGCTYGYSEADELSGADVLISNANEIPDAVASLCG